MSCQTSTSDVLACVGAASVLYAVTALPLMRLARAEHVAPRFVRELPVTAVALFMLLTLAAAPEASR